jgi:hypothetical protein
VAARGARAAGGDAGEDYVRRREFIGLLGVIAAWPQLALSDTAKKRPVIGRLAFPSKDADLFVRYNGQFLSGMRELHYTEGQDFDIVYRFADFRADRLPRLAAELVQLHPDVIVVAASLDAVAAKKATDTIPIVVYSPQTFGEWFAKEAWSIGLPKGFSAHGGRKRAAERKAEAGATALQLMAFFGWESIAMAEKYVRKAERARLARDAAAKVWVAK